MRQIVTTILMLACVAITWTGDANATPPRQWDIGIRPLDKQVSDGPVHLEFFYSGGMSKWKQITLEFKSLGNLTYTGANNIPFPIHRDSQTVWQFEVTPDQTDTSGIEVLAWMNDLGFYLRTGYYFVPTEDSIIMTGVDPWRKSAREQGFKKRIEVHPVRKDKPTRGEAFRPPDSAKIRARLEQQKRDFAPYQLEIELQRKAELELTPLTDLDAQHIRVGDTIFTRKKGEQYFYPAEKVSSSSPPLWAIDTKAFLDKMLDEQKSPYHLSVACPDSACIEFLHDIADTVFLVPWSDRYQVTLNKKGLKKLREKDYKVLPGEHINKQP